jgi:hypothetical protein
MATTNNTASLPLSIVVQPLILNCLRLRRDSKMPP